VRAGKSRRAVLSMTAACSSTASGVSAPSLVGNIASSHTVINAYSLYGHIYPLHPGYLHVHAVLRIPARASASWINC
jgi:hypothetical protein